MKLKRWLRKANPYLKEPRTLIFKRWQEKKTPIKRGVRVRKLFWKMGILCLELLVALSLECEISDWRQISQALPRSVLVDLWQGRSAKSCPLASCCRDSCKAQIILSVWGVLHLYWTQPLSFLQSKTSAECRRVEGGGDPLPDQHSHGTPIHSIKKKPIQT